MTKTAKSSVPSVPSVSPTKRKSTVTVIYRPIEYPDGTTDPAITKWNGITFRANVPVELDPTDKAHCIIQLLPVEIPGQNGETLTKHKEKPVFMGDLARENPSFEVDGKRARRKINTRVVPPAGAEWAEKNEGEISYSDTIDTSVAA